MIGSSGPPTARLTEVAGLRLPGRPTLSAGNPVELDAPGAPKKEVVPGPRRAPVHSFCEVPMLLVNGYVCRNCTDEALAKRGIDPAHPDKAASATGVDGAKKDGPTGALDKTKSKDGVTDSLDANGNDDATSMQLGKNQPERGATVGGSLNLYA